MQARRGDEDGEMVREGLWEVMWDCMNGLMKDISKGEHHDATHWWRDVMLQSLLDEREARWRGATLQGTRGF